LALQFYPRILIVDDDATVGAWLLALCAKHSLLADWVQSAEAAQEHMAQRAYDLCLVDHLLPGLNGLKFAAQVKAQDPSLDVILMTAHADMQGVLDALNVGIFDYLVKPFGPMPEVFARVQRALDKRRVVLENRELIAHLTCANEKVATLNRHLEAEVESRTEELVRANAQLEQMTLTDDVTGLYNQRFLHARLDEEYNRAKRYGAPLSLVMLDLDRFKQANDEHDHLYGSRVLRRTGEFLRQTVRDTDLVVRYGGDEFVIILPHTAAAEAEQAAQRLRTLLCATNLGDAHRPWHCTLSAGVACVTHAGVQCARDLLQLADQALYAAKAAGRNCVVCAHEEAPARVPQAGLAFTAH
jgi:diguanylate cyclase (GGDEF)-like protein